jgi:hypothetical protein
LLSLIDVMDLFYNGILTIGDKLAWNPLPPRKNDCGETHDNDMSEQTQEESKTLVVLM